jgi:hypothetical protein
MPFTANRPDAASTPATAPMLRSLIDTHNGFTLRLPDGTSVGSGISVATRPSRALSFPREHWCDHSVTTWLEQVARLSKRRTTCIGGWIDPRNGAVNLDVVTIVPQPLRWLAIAAGRVLGQHCVFDLTNQKTMVLR